jgi:hypothetical protein
MEAQVIYEAKTVQWDKTTVPFPKFTIVNHSTTVDGETKNETFLRYWWSEDLYEEVSADALDLDGNLATIFNRKIGEKWPNVEIFKVKVKNDTIFTNFAEKDGDIIQYEELLPAGEHMMTGEALERYCLKCHYDNQESNKRFGVKSYCLVRVMFGVTQQYFEVIRVAEGGNITIF